MTMRVHLRLMDNHDERRLRQQMLVNVLIVTLGLLIAQSLACGSRQSTVAVTLTGVDAAAEAFEIWDEQRQAQIVDGALSLADGQAKLGAYRAERGKIEAAFVVAYKAIAAAALDKDASTQGMIDAVRDLYRAIEALEAPPAAAPPAPTEAAPSPTPSVEAHPVEGSGSP